VQYEGAKFDWNSDNTNWGQFPGGLPGTANDYIALMDADVKAIVFRVDSPGGSYVASDTIWDAKGDLAVASAAASGEKQGRSDSL
jgi:hypothetical protein